MYLEPKIYQSKTQSQKKKGNKEKKNTLELHGSNKKQKKKMDISYVSLESFYTKGKGGGGRGGRDLNATATQHVYLRVRRGD